MTRSTDRPLPDRLRGLDEQTDASNARDMRPLLESLHGESYAWALACARGDAAEATDVLQTAYLKVLAGDAAFDGRSSAKTWFFGVVLRTAREHRRRAALSGRILLEIARRRAFEPVPVPSQQQGAEAAERASAVRSALGRLPLRQRQVLTLVFAHDLTLDDAARTLCISPGSARVHYDRGKRRLRALLETP